MNSVSFKHQVKAIASINLLDYTINVIDSRFCTNQVNANILFGHVNHVLCLFP